MSFALRGAPAFTKPGNGFGKRKPVPVAAPAPAPVTKENPVALRVTKKPMYTREFKTIGYIMRVNSDIGVDRYESDLEDWHIVKKMVKGKFIDGIGPEHPDADKEFEQERLEFKENPGDSLATPVDQTRRQRVERELRLCYLRMFFGKWDGKDKTPEALAAADTEWRAAQQRAFDRLRGIFSANSTSLEGKNVQKFFGAVQTAATKMVDLAPLPGLPARVLEYEAMRVLPSYDMRGRSAIDGSVLRGDKNQLNEKMLKDPYAKNSYAMLLKDDYSAQYVGEAPAEFGLELAKRLWVQAEKTGIIDFICDPKQFAIEEAHIKDREQEVAEAAARKAASKAKKTKETTRASAAAAEGISAQNEIRADDDAELESLADDAEDALKEAKTAKAGAKSAEERARVAQARKEEAARKRREKESAQKELEESAAALGITPEVLRNRRRAQASAATRKLKEANDAGFDTVEKFDEFKKKKASDAKSLKEVSDTLDRAIKKLIEDEEKKDRAAIRERMEASRAATAAYRAKQKALQRQQNEWDGEDRLAWLHRQGLLNRMAELRYMQEHMFEWMQEVEKSWFAQDSLDQRSHEVRRDYFEREFLPSAEAAKRDVPPEPRSLASFYDPYYKIRRENGGRIPLGQSMEDEPLNTIPHWFEPLKLSVLATSEAWKAATTSTPPMIQTADGGTNAGLQAVGAIHTLLESVRTQYKPMEVVTGPGSVGPVAVPFDWNSRGYNERVAKDGDLKDTAVHGEYTAVFEANKFRDEDRKLDYSGIAYLDDLPYEYYQVDKFEEADDDESNYYAHIPAKAVLRYLDAKADDPKNDGKKLGVTNRERIIQELQGEAGAKREKQPDTPMLTQKEQFRLAYERAQEELDNSGIYERVTEELVLDTSGEIEVVDSKGVKRKTRARKGAMLAKRFVLDDDGNYMYDEDGRRIEELADDPFYEEEDGVDLETEEADLPGFLDQDMYLDEAHEIPPELAKNTSIFANGEVEYRMGPFARGGSRMGYFVMQKRRISRPDGTGFYTVGEWLAVQEAQRLGISVEEALRQAKEERSGRATRKKKRSIRQDITTERAKEVVRDSGLGIAKRKVLAWLRRPSSTDPTMSNYQVIFAQFNATNSIDPEKMGPTTIEAIIEMEARQHMVAEGDGSVDSDDDSAYNSEGELDDDDRRGEAAVKEVPDEYMEDEEEPGLLPGNAFDMLLQSGPGSAQPEPKPGGAGPSGASPAPLPAGPIPPPPAPPAPPPPPPMFDPNADTSPMDEDDEEVDANDMFKLSVAGSSLPSGSVKPRRVANVLKPVVVTRTSAVDATSQRFARLAMTANPGWNTHWSKK